MLPVQGPHRENHWSAYRTVGYSYPGRGRACYTHSLPSRACIYHTSGMSCKIKLGKPHVSHIEWKPCSGNQNQVGEKRPSTKKAVAGAQMTWRSRSDFLHSWSFCRIIPGCCQEHNEKKKFFFFIILLMCGFLLLSQIKKVCLHSEFWHSYK